LILDPGFWILDADSLIPGIQYRVSSIQYQLSDPLNIADSKNSCEKPVFGSGPRYQVNDLGFRYRENGLRVARYAVRSADCDTFRSIRYPFR
jgi:hypothetical protein